MLRDMKSVRQLLPSIFRYQRLNVTFDVYPRYKKFTYLLSEQQLAIIEEACQNLHVSSALM